MKKLFLRLKKLTKRALKAIKPGSNAVKGASWALLGTTVILLSLFSIITAVGIRDPWLLVLFLIFLIIATVFGFVMNWLLKLIYSIPRILKISLLISIPLLLIILSSSDILLFLSVIVAAISGASIMVLWKTGFKTLTATKKIVTLLGLILGLAGFTAGIVLFIPVGFDVDPIANAAAKSDSLISQINAKSPAIKGSYTVMTMSYGSGKDKHREEFGKDVDFKTDSVNGVAFLDDWNGISGWWREKYWGFDDKSLPINARVWYPEGEGPFPLVLVVHGNHSMQDYSDPGYDYLGELLASRGIILASVDENFINGSWSNIIDGLSKENDARGWLLLEHLKIWHHWNSDANHPFYKKIDTNKIALIGHSRGGEAVSHAAMLNSLPYYSDDASVILDYNFNIRSIVAIAPVDGQYEPGSSRTKFEDVSYFALHGAQDGDVTSFMGSQQYERVSFTDSSYHFKSGLYIYGANHGQFNTSWGNNDVGHPFTRLLNLKQLLSAEDQQKIAQVYISAFLEVTLNDKNEYLPLFTDARKGKDWLPQTIYLNQFEDSDSEFLSTFDEDFDVSSTSLEGGRITSENLTVWREGEIQLNWQKKGSRAVFLGWNYEDIEIEKDSSMLDSVIVDENMMHPSTPDSLIASYSLHFEKGIQNIDYTTVLIFSMAESTENTNPKTQGKWIENNGNKDEEDDDDKNLNSEENTEEDVDEKEQDDEDEKDDKEPDEPLDFSIYLEDSTGQNVIFPLSSFSHLQREIKVKVWKSDFINDDNNSEKIFQIFSYPLNEIVKQNPSFNTSSIIKIRFVFNRSKEGAVVVDNIGFMKQLGISDEK